MHLKFRLVNFLAIGILTLLHIASMCAQQSEQGGQQSNKPDTRIIDSFPAPARNVP